MIAYMLWHPLLLKHPVNYPWDLYIMSRIGDSHNTVPAQTFQRTPHERDAARYGDWIPYLVKIERLP